MFGKTKIDVRIKDKTGNLRKKKEAATLKFFHYFGIDIAREARKVIGGPVRRNNMKPRPPGKAPRTRFRGEPIRQIKYSPNPATKEVLVGPRRFTRFKKRGKFVATGLQEHSGWVRILGYTTKKQRNYKRKKKRHYENMTESQRRVVKAKAKRGGLAKAAARKAQMKWMNVRIVKRPFMATAFKRRQKRIPRMVKQAFREV